MTIVINENLTIPEEPKELHRHTETGDVIFISVHHSSELKGQEGPNGEAWCVFLRSARNPLASGWSWHVSQLVAEELARRVAENH